MKKGVLIRYCVNKIGGLVASFCCVFVLVFSMNTAMGAAGGDLVVNCDRKLVAIDATSEDLLPCACPTGETGTAYDCPTGWTYNTLDGACKRKGIQTSDDRGWYTPTYGTCAATTSSYDCWSVYSCDNRPPDHITDCICLKNACS